MRSIDHVTRFHLLVFFISFFQLPAQHSLTLPENCAKDDSIRETGQNVRILFWNVENLFDYREDTLTADEEFTSGGAMHWNYRKLQTKLAHIAKTILAAGEWNPPAIIGMCEVENRYVLNRLVYSSPLKRFGYRIIHRNSPDSRGIDVAMLYRPDAIVPVYTEWITITFPFDTTVTTREILYIKGLLFGTDTLHLFVNHWPSRLGGESVSAPRRNFVASVLRGKVDSILQSDTRYGIRDTRIAYPESFISYPFIVIMGDFNDEPENESLRTFLGARLDTTTLNPEDLVNLMFLTAGREGSHKFREHWGSLDQFIVSASLLDKQHSLQVDLNSLQIFRPAFLLEDDLRYLDKKPRRTYLGPLYKGGFSDHLPIIVHIHMNGH